MNVSLFPKNDFSESFLIFIFSIFSFQDSSSSSSSDSSTEDDNKSLASDDLGPLHLNENICPIGCDPELYDSAFSMRDERYECEHEIKNAQKTIELLRKEFDGESKKLKQVDGELKNNKKDLEDFMVKTLILVLLEKTLKK